MKNILIITFLSICLISCSHSVILPGSFRQSPIVGGKLWSGHINTGFQSTVELQIFDDIKTNPPLRSSPADSGFIEALVPILPFLDVNLGILSAVDIYYTSALGARWMFYGEPTAEAWKATVFAGSIINNSKTKEDDGTSEAETKIGGIEYGFSVGRQVSQKTLIYFTFGNQVADAKTTVKQPTQTFKYDDKFEHTILTLGLHVGETFFFNGEVSHSQTLWKTDDVGNDKSTSTTYLASLGYMW